MRIHHAGDALSWGEAARESFEPARRRMGLTGTPFRSDANPIPFVTYARDPDGTRRSSADYVYGYGPALGDGVVRPVIFLAYSGEMRWRTRAGDELSGTLGTPMTADQLTQAWRTALDPEGEWVTRVLDAAELEAERDHVLHLPGDDDPERELAEAQRRRDTPDQPGEAAFTALGASAHFDRVLYDGGEFGASAEEEDFLGLPGLLEPEQVALLLRKRQADQIKTKTRSPERERPPGPVAATAGSPPASRQTLAALRKELNGLIAAWHHRTGQPHGTIHAELRRACGGPPLPQATAEQIRARIGMLRRWAAVGR